MTTIAIRPGSSEKLSRTAYRVRNVFVTNESRWGRYEWGTTYTNFWWNRFFVILFMLIAPVCFLAFGPMVLFGYLSWLIVPWSIRRYSKDVETGSILAGAYSDLKKLKGKWAEHGKVFYKQIWDHNCGLWAHAHYRDCRGEAKCHKVTNCDYCNERIVEIQLLLDSQKSVDQTARAEVDNTAMEESQRYREQVAMQLENRQYETDAMREISEGLKK